MVAGNFRTAKALFECGLKNSPNHGALWQAYGELLCQLFVLFNDLWCAQFAFEITSNGNLVSKHRNIGKLERKFESSKIVSDSIQKA